LLAPSVLEVVKSRSEVEAPSASSRDRWELSRNVVKGRPEVEAPSVASEGSTRYANLFAVSSSLRAYGATLKVLGIIVAIMAALGGFYAGVPWLFACIIVGVVVGIGLHVTGTFIAAAGEGLLAVADIALNTRPTERTG
jgi:hypothetical protein